MFDEVGTRSRPQLAPPFVVAAITPECPGTYASCGPAPILTTLPSVAPRRREIEVGNVAPPSVESTVAPAAPTATALAAVEKATDSRFWSEAETSDPGRAAVGRAHERVRPRRRRRRGGDQAVFGVAARDLRERRPRRSRRQRQRQRRPGGAAVGAVQQRAGGADRVGDRRR